jgi:2-keto-4-pentenoate hydratase/2-oxohepta-3-ene-1,7-dioic acid hydratase in catechol pathway
MVAHWRREKESKMRLLFFDDYRLGLLRGTGVHDVTPALGAAGGAPQDRLTALIGRFAELRGTIQEEADRTAAVPLVGLRVRAAVPRPAKIVCAAVNYREHGHHASLPIEFFLKSTEAILDPDGTVELPPFPAKVFQHEAELGVVIGRVAKRVAATDALNYVFAYVPFCDVSARGLEPRSYFTGKSFDTFAPIGPVLVTADEVPDPQGLRVELDVNSDARQRFSTDDMANPVAELIAFASSVTTLRPGDVIATGTNHQALSPLQHGDRVEIRIGDWPALRFNVRDPLGRAWTREIDPEMAARARQSRG